MNRVQDTSVLLPSQEQVDFAAERFPEVVLAPNAPGLSTASVQYLLDLIGGTDLGVDHSAALVDMNEWTPDQWRTAGFGPLAALRVRAALELARRLPFAAPAARAYCREPEQAVNLVGPRLAQLDREELWALYCDAHSRVIGAPFQVSVGDYEGVDVPCRVVFHEALRRRSNSLLLLHNHPTGVIEPSAADRAVTQKLVAAGRQLDITVCDHIIIGRGGGFLSLRRNEAALFR